MKHLVPALRELGLTVVPSVANFIMVPLQSERDVDELYDSVLKAGIIIRLLRAFGLSHCLRITVGTLDQNWRVVEALHRILERVHLHPIS